MQKSEGVVFRKEVGLFRLASLLAVLVLLLGGFAGQMAAQTINGQIVGTVTDPTGAVITGAKVTLTYDLTGQQRQYTTDSSGNFIYPDLVPGTYDISVTQSGFQTYSQKGIDLAATEKLDLHQLQLAVGSQATEITVQASTTHVETDSSEHSALVNSTQMTDVTVKGRNYMSYLSYLPGVTNNSPGGGDVPGWDNTDGVTFNGGNNTVIVMLNGIASADDGIGNSSAAYIAPSPDAIQEMKVQTGNLNAEYGARNGGSINVVYKTGTRDFHGSLYDYQRNRFFNANTFFNKYNNPNSYTSAHPNAYNYANPGGTFGGPFWLPHVPFNKNRDKLFLFFSADLLRFRSGGPDQTIVPSEEERAGNFEEIASNPAYATISGCNASPGCSVPQNVFGFGNNIITGTPVYCPGTEPPSGASQSGGYLSPAQAVNLTATCASDPNQSAATPWVGTSVGTVNPALNIFPMPTCNSAQDLYNGGAGDGSVAKSANPDVLYLGKPLQPCNTGTNVVNYIVNTVNQQPRSDYVLTGQYNLSKSNIWTVDLTKDYQCQCGGTFLGADNGWYELSTNYVIHSSAASSNLVSTIRPNLVNEFIAGTTRALQTVTPSNTTNPNVLGYYGHSLRNSTSPAHNLGPTVLPVIFPDASNTKFGANSQSLGANPFNYIPNFSFGGGIASASGNTRWPFFGTDTHYNLQDDITWVKGAHSFKGGFYFEKVSRNGPAGGGGSGGWNGAINFGGSSTNPNDMNLGIANAYYGIFQSYLEGSAHPNGYDRFHGEEWFIQDTWKATRRLTLDYGIRFAHDVPTYDTVPVSDFRPDLYNSSVDVAGTGQASLIVPCTVGGVRKGCYTNSAGTSTFAANEIGLFAPEGISKIFPFQGMATYSPRQAVLNTPPLNILPRFGFAYDVFGNGKTALRGGFGITNNVFGVVDTIGQLVLSPPSPTALQSLAIPSTSKQEPVITPTIFNSTLPLMLQAQQAGSTCSIFSSTTNCFIGPQSVIGLPRNFRDPQTYNFSLGIQHDLGHGLLLDATYVGIQNRHNSGSINEDVQPYGINWLEADGTYATQTSCAGASGTTSLVFVDPTKGGCTLLPGVFMNYPSTNPAANGYKIQHANGLGILNTNLPGYSGVSQTYNNLNSNYNSLQTQISKRFGRTVTLNLAWTYAKTLGWGEPSLIAPKSVWRTLYYNQSGPKHNIVANWTYNLPQTHFQHAIIKQALGGWVYEGTFQYTTGSAGSVGAPGLNYGGGGGFGSRVNLVAGQSVYNVHGIPPSGNGGKPLRQQYLNLNAFAVPTGGQGVCDGTPANCGFGDSGRVNYIGPSTNNVDMSIFKDFALSKTHESRKFEFRFETYNTFNHTEFSGVSTGISASFVNKTNTAGGVTISPGSNSGFGQFNNTNPPRIMSLAARLYF